MCETARDQRDFSFTTSPFFSIFLLSFPFHTVVFISRIHTPLLFNPSPPLSPLCLFYPLEHPPPPPARVWAGGMDKNVGQETQSFLDITVSSSLCNRFLELRFVLYSARRVQRPFPPFLAEIVSARYVMQRDEIKTAL